MKFLRNPEIIKTLFLWIAITAVASIAAAVWDRRFGCFTLGLSLLFLLIHMGITYRRYRRLYDLSADIDRILHGDDTPISLDSYQEGELGILQSEVSKMTVRLRQQRQQLQEDKIYLADLIADISHQIRTPLTSANLLISLLSDLNLTDQRRIQLTHELLSLLSRVDWLITTLLKLSKLDAGTVRFQRETIPMERLIREGTAPLLVAMELREQNLVIKAGGNFTGDVGWTAEALGNIVKNCMEHTSNGGTIAITADENALFTQITVEDSGCGIDAADLPHIFERFYKGKHSGDKSFGIGLALARTIITAQNGSVKAENRKPNGARFTVRFYKGTI